MSLLCHVDDGEEVETRYGEATVLCPTMNLQGKHPAYEFNLGAKHVKNNNDRIIR